MNNDLKIKEYELLQKLEIESTKIRHTTFTALLSVSFLIPTITTKSDTPEIKITSFSIQLGKLAFLLGFIFYTFSVFHYWWYHKQSHSYRSKLKKLETELGFTIYNSKSRPEFKSYKMRFIWSLYIIGVFYGIITAIYVGEIFFLIVTGLIVISYLLLMKIKNNKSKEHDE